ncbi:hypothetical protein C2I19_09890 [Chromobacterium alticapitis]|uniref:Uncharacterized protein n=1 Tax=Chromobacterium alticapitis TaxID=2073169 RepID=A0A2S5DGF1_9NEIS|nr:hypothetical protein C2I19_09890 [Chromobacterium alticapitis]
MASSTRLPLSQQARPPRTSRAQPMLAQTQPGLAARGAVEQQLPSLPGEVGPAFGTLLQLFAADVQMGMGEMRFHRSAPVHENKALINN